MEYDFDKLTDRTGTASLKWDIKENELPMWVADMDFETAPAIVKAIEKRAESGIFGYSVIPPQWSEAICGWWRERHHYNMQPETLLFCTGVVPAIVSIIRTMTSAGDNVLIQSPVYNIFFKIIRNNGRNVVENKLKYDGTDYSVDFEDLEQKLADPKTTLMILCNPQNPTGKIWDRETLGEIGRLCIKHNVLVVSDEIHCDITDPEKEYVPFASVSEELAMNSVTCISPTKTFNIAGIQTSTVMVPDRKLRRLIGQGLRVDELSEPNAFAVNAAIAAFTEGGEWLEQLKRYIYENKLTVKKYLEENIPMIKLVPSEATYLLWLDCTAFVKDGDNFAEYIRNTSGLWVSDGSAYGNGDKFLRMNIATQRERVLDGLERLRKSTLMYMK
ncbi:MAG: MalY/PatB family protein [Ruminiclostridium sp.]